MWTLIATVSLKLLDMFLKDKTLYYKFLEQFAKDGALKSVKLNDSYKAQLKKLLEEGSRLKKKKPKP